ncbi:unnamed protein product [Cuscuta europaea]|uniref:Uncharacterized protein n=1 Tax=Cuscuta europaea TaxID=41803 RepID=A0A9P1E3A7_CUSEU|nr:unnamed protein product [Cuscuta europaea]
MAKRRKQTVRCN